MKEPARVHYKNFIYDSARWDGFALRPDDIVISTPPKCGTTWMQNICALLVFQTPDLDQPLMRVSPWLDMLLGSRADVFAALEAQQHRRFIKTHTPFDGLPFDEGVTYLCVGRDPRDVALSLAARLSIAVADERWPELARAASFESMRRRARPGARGSRPRGLGSPSHRGVLTCRRPRLPG